MSSIQSGLRPPGPFLIPLLQPVSLLLGYNSYRFRARYGHVVPALAYDVEVAPSYQAEAYVIRYLSHRFPVSTVCGGHIQRPNNYSVCISSIMRITAIATLQDGDVSRISSPS